jgi:hypothetical protein
LRSETDGCGGRKLEEEEDLQLLLLLFLIKKAYFLGLISTDDG